MKTLKINMLKGEYWYGGHITFGFFMPISRLKIFRISSKIIKSYNQFNTLLVSNKGRYIYSESSYDTSFIFGRVTCKANYDDDIIFREGFDDLKGAYLNAMKNHFPFDGKYPEETMFKVPQYCTWIQLLQNQNQKDILAYAESILEAGMPAGELIIDDGWQTHFGEWTFDTKRFENPNEMIKKLHDLGFKVILWICPFVSDKAKDFEYLKENDCLVRDSENQIAYRKWWNGVDPLLDLTNPKALEWFYKTADGLINQYGVDGFKQDAGDPMYYKNEDTTFAPTTANEQCLIWAKTALNYKFNELRACYKGGGLGIAQRLADKSHSWTVIGLKALVPNALLQGLMGYPYSCPDMIGGGQSGDFKNGSDNVDLKLLQRYAYCSALMPMMQFSLAFWNFEDEKTKNSAINSTKLHLQFSDYIIELAKNASITGEPIVRYLEYQFPNEGLHKYKYVFMLGEKYLVAPIINKRGSVSFKLPRGNWKYKDKTYVGGKKVKFTNDDLVILERI